MTMKATRGRMALVATCLLLAGVPAFAQDSAGKAWATLEAGLAEKGVGNRAAAVRVLGLLENNSKAAGYALKALKDEKPEVRAAAAESLGQMKAKSAAPTLVEVMKAEKDAAVVIAGARSLIAFGDPLGYAVYYAVLTGERKTGGELMEEQKKMLKDPKKMARFGFEQGIGFIPYVGIGFGVVKGVTKDDASPVRAAAAKILAKDPDAKSGEALVKASSDKSWMVRAAALDALSHRGDPGLLLQIEPKLKDENAAVRYTAAAAILHLRDVQAGKGR